MTVCRSCDAYMTWGRTEGGRMIPLNADAAGTPLTFDDGNVVHTGETFLGRRGEGMPVVRIMGTPGPGLMKSHFATCPNATDYRRSP